MAKIILKLKKPQVTLAQQVTLVQQPDPVKKKIVLKLKKPPHAVPLPLPEPVLVKEKVVLKLKKTLPIPPPPAPGAYVTKAMEAFEAIREYYQTRGKIIPQDDIKWYHEELIQEKKEFDEFWERCAETKANMDCVLRGDDEWTTALAINAARQKVKALPVREEDIGPMPDYGTKDFWAWCHKRKKLKEQKDAAIIAAGGKIKEKKVKTKRGD